MALIRTAREAEEAAARWLRNIGFSDVELTPPGPDGGLDVASGFVAAQVKAEVKPIGRPVIQQTLGVARALNSIPFCFALGGYTADARLYGETNGVALLQFDLQGYLEPLTSHAESMTAIHVRPCIDALYSINWTAPVTIPRTFSADDSAAWSSLAVGLEQALEMRRDTRVYVIYVCESHRADEDWAGALQLSTATDCGPHYIARALRIIARPREYYGEIARAAVLPHFLPERPDGLVQPSVAWNTAEVPPRLIAAGGVAYLRSFVAANIYPDMSFRVVGALPGMS